MSAYYFEYVKSDYYFQYEKFIIHTTNTLSLIFLFLSLDMIINFLFYILQTQFIILKIIFSIFELAIANKKNFKNEK